MNKKKLLMAMTIAMCASAAQAGLTVANEPPPPPPPVVIVIPTLAHVGDVPERPAKMKSNIKGLRASVALKRIVPRGWKGFTIKDPKISEMGKVTIKSKNKPWPDVLEEWLDNGNLTATLNWDKKELTIRAID